MNQKIKSAIKSDYFKKFSIYGFGQFFNLVTPLLLIPYIVGVCGEENFGKVSIALALSFFLIVFIDYGSELVGVREVTINRNDQKGLQKILLTNLSSRFIILITLLIVSFLLIFAIPYLKEEFILFSFSLLVIVGQYLNQSWFLQGIDNINWISISTIVSKIIYVIGVLFLVTEKEDYIYVNLCFALGTIISNGIFTYLIFKKYNFNYQKIKKQEIKDFLQRDFKMFTSQIFVAIQLYSPVILVGFIGGNFMAGQYRIVEQIIITFKTYIFLFFNFTYPRVCHDIYEKPTKASKNWLIINSINVFFISFLMLIICFNAEFIINFFNSSNVNELSNLLKIAVLLPVLLAISIGLKQLVLGYNYQKQYVRATSVSVILSLILVIFMLPVLNLLGVFYSLIITEVIVIIFYLFCIRKRANLF
ncbi:oligosaccharide flippase family protein [Flavobacterium orientale]|uniref:Oligosaccharide translocase/flippase n=1 Tax=Flavobacterium orientale TaxID=1756020 RepID=A0A917DAH3_9FLAO|nr:oligosaccharide flippase family protein [Flavobacterium orientale]GGD22678.1 oligosaccharide translocase/flippase [Flavobacterium orientale]